MIDALRRIGIEQIDAAIASVGADGDLDDRVHDIRKRMKKTRGLIRLVRPVFPDYAAENAYFRDTARSLSGVRDAAVMTATLDRLIETHEEPLDPEAFEDLRKDLASQKAEAPDLGPIGATLKLARERVAHWTLHETGWDAVSGGLAKTYRRARKGRGAKGDEDLHAWRKPIKYHWYHVRLLERIWPEGMAAQASAADEIGEALGLHQDLSVLDRHLGGADVSRELRRVLRGLIDRRKVETRAMAREIAPRLLSEKPKLRIARWKDLWQTWREGS